MRKQYSFSLRHLFAVTTVLSVGLAVAADAGRRYQSAKVVLDSTEEHKPDIVERAEGDLRVSIAEISLLIPASVLGLGWVFIEFSRRPAPDNVFPMSETPEVTAKQGEAIRDR